MAVEISHHLTVAAVRFQGHHSKWHGKLTPSAPAFLLLFRFESFLHSPSIKTAFLSDAANPVIEERDRTAKAKSNFFCIWRYFNFCWK